MKRFIAALLALATVLAVGGTPARAGSRVSPSGAIDITGVDLHDGMLFQTAGLYVLVGTQYGCGFQWGLNPWCGFGASTAPSLDGPWTSPVLLFPPSSVDPFRGMTWSQVCGQSAAGCFNPRLVQRANDGVWVLWFNSPSDWTAVGANAYNVMGCAGPAGPCGPGATPNGSYSKPRAYTCATSNGDESILTDGTSAWLECTGADRVERVEPLDFWWANGVGGGVALPFQNVEGAGAYRDPTSGLWISTLSWPECGYCAGTSTVYATAPGPLGPWTYPANTQVLNDPVGYARATISGSSCGGQPRTVVVLGGQPYQVIDLWTGGRNETAATVHLEPLHYLAPTGTAGDGRPWLPFAQWGCD